MMRLPSPLISALLSMLMAASLAWAGPACVVPENGGVGGTGAPAFVGGLGGTGAPTGVGGLGGTGRPRPSANGGVGGTGHQGENTGILGTITGFGSVCVNGLEVNYTPATAISRNGETTTPDRLALGQVVAIEATGPDGGLAAKAIAILEAVSGPVTATEKNGLLRVMDQPVRLTGETRLAGVGRFSELTADMPVRVSGYRNAADEVVATRIEPAPGLAMASLVTSSYTTGPAGQAAFRPGEWLIRGRWDGKFFQPASRVPALPFVDHASRVIVEGLVLEHTGPGRLRISGFEVSYEAQGESTGVARAQVGQRVRIAGWSEPDGRVKASQFELFPMTAPGSGGMSSGAGGMSPAGAMTGAGMNSPGTAFPPHLLPIVRPGAIGGMGGMSGGRMGR